MKHLFLATTALTLAASGAFAGGLERTTQSTAILFEKGRYFETTFSFRSPSISGTQGAGPTASGNIGENSFNFGFAYKADLNDTWSYALIYDQPYGADIAYPVGTGYPAQGSNATFESHALTGILEYNLPSNVSLYAGLRAQSIEADAAVPFAGAYTVVGERDFSLGYLAGASYERPDIALRVALTYLSEINHDLDTIERGAASPATSITTPQAVNLEFQSGIAEDTLLFGSVRWVDWTEGAISPQGFPNLVSFADDRTTFTLGVGRRLNETWSVLGSLGYEETTGSQTGNLAPVDGFKSVSLGAIRTSGNVKTTFGVRYVDLGDSINTSTLGANFTGNSAIGAGVKIGWQF